MYVDIVISNIFNLNKHFFFNEVLLPLDFVSAFGVRSYMVAGLYFASFNFAAIVREGFFLRCCLHF